MDLQTLALIGEAIPLAWVLLSVGSTRRQIDDLVEWKREHEKIWSERWGNAIDRLNQANMEIKIKDEQYKNILEKLDEVRADIAIIHTRCSLCTNHSGQ